MKTMSRVGLCVGLLSLAWAAGGCGEGPFHVEVFLDPDKPEIQERSIEVNILGVSDTQLPKWEQMVVSEYWKPESDIRAGADAFQMHFGQDLPTSQVLKKNDPKWKGWLNERNAKHLVVLAHLVVKDMPGRADPRRIILPLKIERWEWYLWGDDTIRIQLGPGGIEALRQPKKE